MAAAFKDFLLKGVSGRMAMDIHIITVQEGTE
jgi:hypothetical protein